MSEAINYPKSEIWIYTTDYKDRTEPPIKVRAFECSKEEIPTDKHWIFVFISDEVTMYVDAYDENGKLQNRIRYKEPQDVITKTKIEPVRATADVIHKLINNSSVIGNTYGLDLWKVCCQSFVKELLKKLGVGSDLKIINDTPLGFFVEAGKWSAEKAKGSFEYFFPPKEKKN